MVEHLFTARVEAKGEEKDWMNLEQRPGHLYLDLASIDCWSQHLHNLSPLLKICVALLP